MKTTRRQYLILCLVLVGLLAGCGSRLKLKAQDLTRSVVTVDEKGKLSEGIVEEFKESYYSNTELKEFIETSMEEYNAEYGKDRVQLASFQVKEKSAKAVLNYTSVADYARLHGTLAQWTDLEKAMGEEWLPETVTSWKDQKDISIQSLKNPKKLHVLLIEEACEVRVDGTIVAYSNATKDAKSKKNDSLKSEDGPSVIIYQS